MLHGTDVTIYIRTITSYGRISCGTSGDVTEGGLPLLLLQARQLKKPQRGVGSQYRSAAPGLLQTSFERHAAVRQIVDAFWPDSGPHPGFPCNHETSIYLWLRRYQ